jgi:energy-coupling factor transport system permease protein
MGELGFYSPGHSFFHKLHPVSKIVTFAILLAIVPLLTTQMITSFMLVITLFLFILLARIGKKQLLYFFPAWAIVFFSAVSWLFVDLGGHVMWETTVLGFTYRLKEFSVVKSVNMSLRSIIWVLGYILLLTTTSSRELVVGLEKLGVPHKVSVAVGMTLKFWGNILDDTKKIIEAQKARGIDFDGASRLQKVKKGIMLTSIPAIFLMLKRFRTLSFALSLRAFGVRGKKTRIFSPVFKKTDWGFIAFFFLLCLVLLFVDWKVR